LQLSLVRSPLQSHPLLQAQAEALLNLQRTLSSNLRDIPMSAQFLLPSETDSSTTAIVTFPHNAAAPRRKSFRTMISWSLIFTVLCSSKIQRPRSPGTSPSYRFPPKSLTFYRKFTCVSDFFYISAISTGH
jgi:hypothetical protein